MDQLFNNFVMSISCVVEQLEALCPAEEPLRLLPAICRLIWSRLDQSGICNMRQAPSELEESGDEEDLDHVSRSCGASCRR